MFKAIWYIFTTIVGILFFFKLFSKKENRIEIEDREIPESRYLKVKEKKGIPTDLDTLIRKSKSKLNSRQIEILKLFKKRTSLIPSDIYSLHPQVSTRTLRRDMEGLAQLNIVKQEGKTRDAKYLLRD